MAKAGRPVASQLDPGIRYLPVPFLNDSTMDLAKSVQQQARTINLLLDEIAVLKANMGHMWDELKKGKV